MSALEPVRIGGAELWLGDCREVLPTLGKVDAVVTDPPYGVGLTRKNNRKSLQATTVYDDTPDTIERLVVCAANLYLAQSTRACVFSGYRMMWAYPRPTSVGTVFCPSGSGRDPWGFGCNNPILFYGKCPYLSSGRGSRPNSFQTCQHDREEIDHPCPKPLEWMRWAVNRASLEGETVLDPFMGSGTTGVACAHLGRRFIGIEVEPKYFDIACRRITEAQRQADLFVEPAPKPKQMEWL